MTRCRAPARLRVRDFVDVCVGGEVASGSSLFGKRYLVPALGTWLNPDPLAVHSPGSADLNLYAYVGGQLLRAVDPLGLDAQESWLAAFLRSTTAGAHAVRPSLLPSTVPTGVRQFHDGTNAEVAERGAAVTKRAGPVGAAMALAVGGGALVAPIAGPPVVAAAARGVTLAGRIYNAAGIHAAAKAPVATAIATKVASSLSWGPDIEVPGVQGSVWALSNNKRGFLIGDALGENLRKNFPVIDRWLAGPGKEAAEVTSIKSLDWNAATFTKEPGRITSTLTKHIDALASFVVEKDKGGVEVIAGESTRRVLAVGVPQLGGTPAQIQALERAGEYAASQGVHLEVTKVK